MCFEPHWSKDGQSIYALVEDDRNQHLVRFDVSSGMSSGCSTAGAKSPVTTWDREAHRPPRQHADPLEEVFALERGATRACRSRTMPGSRASSRARPKRFRWRPGRHAHQRLRAEAAGLSRRSALSHAAADTRRAGFAIREFIHISGRSSPRRASSSWRPIRAAARAVASVRQGDLRGLGGEGHRRRARRDRSRRSAGHRGSRAPRRRRLELWRHSHERRHCAGPRFKAAISGASISNALAGYGTDMYMREYEIELGLPWKNLDTYLRNSYPFLHADRIVTPTLFMCGDQDFNVPLLNSEQMYQALAQPWRGDAARHLSRRISRPSQAQLSAVTALQRYLDWHGKYFWSKVFHLSPSGDEVARSAGEGLACRR